MPGYRSQNSSLRPAKDFSTQRVLRGARTIDEPTMEDRQRTFGCATATHFRLRHRKAPKFIIILFIIIFHFLFFDYIFK